MRPNIKLVTITFFTLITLSFPCWAADVLFIDAANQPSAARNFAQMSCKLYGLEMATLKLAGQQNISQEIETALHNEKPLAVITTGASLEAFAKNLRSSLFKDDARKIPFLIMELSSATNVALLRQWSEGAVLGCAAWEADRQGQVYGVENVPGITAQLGNQEIPFPGKVSPYLITKKGDGFQTIIKINNTAGQLLPVFGKTAIAGREIFFQSQMPRHDLPAKISPQFLEDNFYLIAPLLMFLRSSCGEHCWHSDRHFANLTIDDPWLIEPYGNLSYKRLLKEMQVANFHTTIAFIPWNFDRSRAEVVQLFKEYPERYSLCYHGNNHDHYEFYKYDAALTDPRSAKSLGAHETNLQQAMARIARFHELTGLSCDRVMVFPQGIGPAETLGLLKKYNFLATVNGDNVPLGARVPDEPLFGLRPITLDFADFPSVKRYHPQQRSQVAIARDLFLDNPVFFYEHQQDFERANAFNETAQMVNAMQPDMIWQSPGYIMQHYYLEKLNNNGTYEIKAFSNSLIIRNRHSQDATFLVKKEESFSIPIKQVTLDERPCHYERSPGKLLIKVSVPPHQEKRLVIRYENNLDLSKVDISKNNLRINLLRKLSDIRDMDLSTNYFVRPLVKLYYHDNLYKFGLMGIVLLIIVLGGIIIASSVIIFKKIRKPAR